MRLNIFRSENSTALTLPEGMLDALRLREGEDVFVALDVERQRLVITRLPAEVEDVDVEYARQVAGFIDAYRPALESLAAP